MRSEAGEIDNDSVGLRALGLAGAAVGSVNTSVALFSAAGVVLGSFPGIRPATPVNPWVGQVHSATLGSEFAINRRGKYHAQATIWVAAPVPANGIIASMSLGAGPGPALNGFPDVVGNPTSVFAETNFPAGAALVALQFGGVFNVYEQLLNGFANVFRVHLRQGDDTPVAGVMLTLPSCSLRILRIGDTRG